MTFLSELTKFGVVPAHLILHVFKVFVDDFSGVNIDNTALLLEKCGRYLMRTDETKEKMVSLVRWLFRSVSAEMARDIAEAGGEIKLGVEITSVASRTNQLSLDATTGTIASRHVVTCAGLQADRLARLTGSIPMEQIVPFRGDYYTLTESAAAMVRGLIYPVPDPRFPFAYHPGHVWRVLRQMGCS